MTKTEGFIKKHEVKLWNVAMIALILLLLAIVLYRVEVLTTHPCMLCEQYMNCLPNTTSCITRQFDFIANTYTVLG